METPSTRNSSSLQIYLRGISAIDHKRHARGDEGGLLDLVREGGPKAVVARQKLIEVHIRLVVSIARHYQGTGLDLDDLISVGNLGLVKAIDKINAPDGKGFDPSKGSWITYVMTTIDRTIERAIAETSRTVRVPINVHDALWKMEKTTAALETKLGRTPDTDELAEALKLTRGKVEALRLASGGTISLDAPAGPDRDDDRQFLDLVDDKRQSTEAAMIEAERGKTVSMLLGILTPREREIIARRFGFQDGEELPLSSIAREFGISGERVRQISASAIEKMRQGLNETQFEQLLN